IPNRVVKPISADGTAYVGEYVAAFFYERLSKTGQPLFLFIGTAQSQGSCRRLFLKPQQQCWVFYEIHRGSCFLAG
ncbi:MAG: hypothetical protein RQ735_10840, partial [Flavobacteriaceae bacterium]|nr:hypothetical protein [Flavobacteriaceae bacterium]